VVLDEVHERSLDVDLLLLLLRRTLLVPPREQHRPVPPKLVLMSATADAKGFVSYFDRPGPCADLGMLAGQSHARAARRLDVAMLNIPGFTHPVRQFWLEDALQATGLVVGRGSRCDGHGSGRRCMCPSDLLHQGESRYLDKVP
jgi:ATP-dependent RNA helicase DHX57